MERREVGGEEQDEGGMKGGREEGGEEGREAG